MEIDPSLVKKSGKTAEEIKELREIFQLVDTDGRGNISKPALEKLIKMVGIPTNEMDIDLMMTEMAGVSNEINFESFLLTFTKKVHTSITLKEMKDAEAVQAYNVWRNVKKSGT